MPGHRRRGEYRGNEHHNPRRTIMTDPKITAVQSVYEAFGRGDVGYILDQLTDDVDWASCPGSDVAPWHGIHRGKAEVPNYFKALADTVQVTEFTPLAFAASETDVMVVIRLGGTVPATGKSVVMDIHHWFRFRDGKIYVYRGTEDTAAMQEALS
jgi:ketosteroid isomerase-like protein